MRQLMAIPEKDFSDCFEKWKERWDKCVRSQGEYFEGDWGSIVLDVTFFLILIGLILSRQNTYSCVIEMKYIILHEEVYT